MCDLSKFKDMRLCYLHRGVLKELEEWHHLYLPVDISGLNVIDGGAGCGETARFYLEHGAKSVLSIESDPECFKNLQHNFKDEPRVIPLLFKVDHMKWDIEGGERDSLFMTHFPSKFQMIRPWSRNGEGYYLLREFWGGRIDKAKRKIGNRLLGLK